MNRPDRAAFPLRRAMLGEAVLCPSDGTGGGAILNDTPTADADPMTTANFSDPASARTELHSLLIERLNERRFINDARVRMAIDSLSADEIHFLNRFKDQNMQSVFGFKNDGSVNFLAMASVPRLLDKQVVRLAGSFDDGAPGYRWTQLGFVVMRAVTTGLTVIPLPKVQDASPDSQADATEQPSPDANPLS